jgi:hypothetical protein
VAADWWLPFSTTTKSLPCKLEYIVKISEADSGLVPHCKAFLGDLIRATGIVADQIKASLQAIIVVTEQQSILAVFEKAPVDHVVFDNRNAASVESVGHFAI